jgi:hypothetical protein
MLMPEAAMNEDDSFSARKDEVGLAGQILAMKPEAIARAM